VDDYNHLNESMHLMQACYWLVCRTIGTTKRSYCCASDSQWTWI